MCGIAGFWLEGELRPQDSTILNRMLEIIRHRGPDGHDRYLSPENGLAMGHTRLSIIDLATGDQPLYNAGRRIVLTANGEFYDYKRLRADLMSRGERFATKSDSELALRLYERFGMDFVHHLRGEFAFALFDHDREQLLLVRDRFGIKPLFYHIQGNNLYYGSEIKALLTHPDVPRRLDHRAALHQLMQTMVPGTTAFEGIQALLPGHMLIVRRDSSGRLSIQAQRYWDMAFPEASARTEAVSEAEWIERVRAALIEAVTLRLEADVPVGCYLSGGIDSCSILGLATGAQQSPVKAFTISFQHKDYDESHIAREMAESMKADQEILSLTTEDLYGENYVKAVWHAERTFYNTLGVAKWCMSRRVHECGYKVVVTGEGSDELFGGYPFFKRDMLLYGQAGGESGKAGSGVPQLSDQNRIFQGAILSEKSVSHPAFDALCGFTPSWIQPWMLTLELARELLHPDLKRELHNYDPIAAIADALSPEMIQGRHVLDKVQYTWAKTMLEGQILNWGGDRMDMANAMESRPPFLDHHLAELAVQIPPELRIKGNVEKWVLREAMKGILPEVLYKREKFAFMAPPGFRSAEPSPALQQLIETYLSDEAVSSAGLVDPARLRAFLKTYDTGDDPVLLTRRDALINHLLGLHILHKSYVETSPSSTFESSLLHA